MNIESIKPTDIYIYLDIRSTKAVTRANREKSLLSHMFTMAIRWGLTNTNPCQVVRRNREKKHERYITDDEFNTALLHASPLIRGAMNVAYITGLRKGDILSIKLSDLTEDGLLVEVNKSSKYNKKKLKFEWTDKLSSAINEYIKSREKPASKYLFETRTGSQYSTDGFDSIWQRFMTQLIVEKILQERFRFHDIRRKTATDAEKRFGREYARQLLGHDSQRMTARYISGVNNVKRLSNCKAT
jgi:integrase